MDAKITKSRLGLLLSYDWIKIVGICTAVVLLWLLIFTMTATRATTGQSFELYAYGGVSLNTMNFPGLGELREKGAFSEDVLDFAAQSVTEDQYQDMILQAWFAAGQGDAILLADSEPTLDENGNVTAYTGLTEFLRSDSYRSNSYWLGEDGYEIDGRVVYEKSYFTQCAEYLNRFYPGGYEGGTLENMDRAAVEKNFRARIEGDKRYKNEVQIAEGLEKEYARIRNLRDAFAAVYEWTHNDSAEDPVELRVSRIEYDSNGDGTADGTFEWTFAFDLSNIKNITRFAGNNSDGPSTSEGLCLVALSGGCLNEVDLAFEQFTLLKYLADTYM